MAERVDTSYSHNFVLPLSMLDALRFLFISSPLPNNWSGNSYDLKDFPHFKIEPPKCHFTIVPVDLL